MADKDWTELTHKEALAYLRSLAPMTKAEIAYYGEAAASRAFTAAGVYRLDILQDMLNEMEEAFAGNVTLETFVETFAEQGLGAGHLETVFRTNMQSAYGRGNFDQGMDSDISDAIWGWRYHTVGDDRVREEHEDLQGAVFAKGEGEEVFPPWDYNCRCTAEWITQNEAEEEGLTSDKIPASARDRMGETGFLSPALREEHDPDLGDYDLGLIREYLEEQ